MTHGWTGRPGAAIAAILLALLTSACDPTGASPGDAQASAGADTIGAGFVHLLPGRPVRSLKDIGLTAARKPTEANAVVRGPFFEAAVEEVATTDQLTADQTDALQLWVTPRSSTWDRPKAAKASTGVEIILASLVRRPFTVVDEGADPNHLTTAVLATLHVGDRATPLQLPDSESVLVVGAATGTPVSLEILGAYSPQQPKGNGHPQSVDLRTGTRTTGAIGLYYPVRQVKLSTSIGPSGVGEVSGGGLPDALFGVSLKVHAATLLPYSKTRGWAPTGQAWLMLEGAADTGIAGGNSSCLAIKPSAPASRSIEVVVNGRTASGVSTDWRYGNAAIACDVHAQFVAIYAVPASSRSVTVRMFLPHWMTGNGSRAAPVTVRLSSGRATDTGRITLPA